MFDLVVSGGWLMLPIIVSSVIALAIICERFIALRRQKIIPKGLVSKVWQMVKNDKLSIDAVKELQNSSPLGRVLAAGLNNLHNDREVMKEAIEDIGRHEVHHLERYLNTLGTIAAITPLLGLLGTVVGMISVFNAIMNQGDANAAALAGGISQALITTGAGLSVAIPTLIAYRYYRGLVDELVVYMEQEALKLVEVIHGRRQKETLD